MNQMKSLENRKLSFKNLLSEVPEYACVVVLVIVLIVAGCVSPVFFTDTNIQNVLKQGAVLAVLSIGMGYVLISGCIDQMCIRDSLMPMDFIQYRLCGNCVTDHTMAAGTMMYDIHGQAWMEDLLGENGIGAGLLPDIAWAGSVAGTLLPETAKELGLGTDVIVAVGAQDQKCAAYGGGASEQVVTVSLGTGSCITKLSEAPVLDDEMRIPVFSYLYQGCWDMEGVVNTAGSALEWFRKKFAPSMDYEELSGMAAHAETGGLKFYPYLSGGASPHWGEGAGAFTGLTLQSGIPECVRALLEGIAYHIKANTDVMDKAGQAADTLRVFGGGSKSDLWCRLIRCV